MYSKEREAQLKTEMLERGAAVAEMTIKAASENRDLSRSERASLAEHERAVTELKAKLGELESERGLIGQLDDLSDRVTGTKAGTYTPVGAKANRAARWGEAVVRANSDEMGRFKSGLVPSGAVVVAVPQAEPVALGQPVTGLRQLLPSEITAGVYSFLRQVIRTSNAAVVAQGTRKPTSIYETELISDRTRTIAHLSTPVARQTLSDAPAVQTFVESELFFGLRLALDEEIINGDGTGDRMTGLAHTSGVQTQAAPGTGEDVFTVTRKALTKLETRGLVGTGFVANPLDWEAIELLRDDMGRFYGNGPQQAAPVDSAARRLWSLPVVTTPACPVGTAYVADWVGSTRLYLREDARLDWSENVYSADKWGAGQGGSLFEANEIMFRAEMRAGFAVLRPSGVVKVALA